MKKINLWQKIAILPITLVYQKNYHYKNCNQAKENKLFLNPLTLL
jgi:hypothetical protein